METFNYVSITVYNDVHGYLVNQEKVRQFSWV